MTQMLSQIRRKQLENLEVVAGALEKEVFLLVLVLENALHRRVHEHLYRVHTTSYEKTKARRG